MIQFPSHADDEIVAINDSPSTLAISLPSGLLHRHITGEHNLAAAGLDGD
jgi:hypothetical protein